MLMRGRRDLALGTRWCQCACVSPSITSRSPSRNAQDCTSVSLSMPSSYGAPSTLPSTLGHTFRMRRNSNCAVAPRESEPIVGVGPRKVRPSVCQAISSFPSK